MTERFIAALIGSPFGLSGRVKIESLSGEKNHLFNLQKVLLRKENSETEYKIEEFFSSPFSFKLKGINSPEEARALKGAEIIISRAEAVPLSQGEFYIEDLRGLEVTVEGTFAGTIGDLIEGGGGFLAEIVLTNQEKRLIPFRNEFFGTINLEENRIELLHKWILE